MKGPLPEAVAYSYDRFSAPEQASGDSIRRQVALRENWLGRHPGVRLDQSLSLTDLGVSAFRGKNALVGNLGVFLKAIETGRVKPGSILLVESLDRISRQGIDEGYEIVKRILKAGVRIVTFSPEREFDRESVRGLTKGALEIQLILERAAEESETKSQRLVASWSQKKLAARNGQPQPPRRKTGRVTHAMTGRLPAWVKEEKGELVLIPERAAAVRRIFALSIAGYGAKAIIKTLTREGFKPFGSSGTWIPQYIFLILKDRRALGELQPLDKRSKRSGTPDGEPIPGYYPAVVSEKEWTRARAAARLRKRAPGSVGKTYVNVFANLIKHARDGDTYWATKRNDQGKRQHILINRDGQRGRTTAYTFPFAVFEEAILRKLEEIDPADVLDAAGPETSEAETLKATRDTLEARIAALEAELRQGDVAAVVRVLRELEDEHKAVLRKLAEVQQQAAHPAPEAWKDTHNILDALNTIPAGTPEREHAMLRLRQALRRITLGIWLLVVPRGRTKLAAVQVWFAGGQARRDYLLFYQPTTGNKLVRHEGFPRVWSEPNLEGLDLRKPADAQKRARTLMELDLEALLQVE